MVEHLRSPVPEKMRGDGIYSPSGANGLREERGHTSSGHKEEDMVQMGRCWANIPKGLLLVPN